MDHWILLKSPFQKESKIHVSEKDKEGNFKDGCTIISMGPKVNDPSFEPQVALHAGMRVYYEPEVSMPKVFQEDIYEAIIEEPVVSVGADGLHNFAVSDKVEKVEKKKPRLLGRYEYYLVQRNMLMGYVRP